MPNITVSPLIDNFLKSTNAVTACSSLSTVAYSSDLVFVPTNRVNGGTFVRILQIVSDADTPEVYSYPNAFFTSVDTDSPSHCTFVPPSSPTNALNITINTGSGSVILEPSLPITFTNINVSAEDTLLNLNDQVEILLFNTIAPNLTSLSVTCTYSTPVIYAVPNKISYLYLASTSGILNPSMLDSNINQIAADTTALSGTLDCSSWLAGPPTSASQTARASLTARGWTLIFN